MSRFDYEQSKAISIEDPTFAALIFAAIRKADSTNSEVLWTAFPDLYAEFRKRYNAPGGFLEGDTQ